MRSGSRRSRAPRPARRSSPCRAGSRRASGSAGDPATRCSRSRRRASSATWWRSRGASAGRPCVAITASAGSPLAAAADATVLQRVASQRAVTHTQALAGAYASGLALWAALAGDTELAGVLAAAPDAAARAVRDAEAWAADADHPALPAAAVVVGGGTAWAAALELALMLKEISRIPAEGVETREGATSAMFGLGPGQLMVSLDPAGDPLGDEAVRLCAAAGATTLRLPGSGGRGRAPGADHDAPGRCRAGGRARAVGRPRRRPPDLDRRLLRDRAERAVSLRLGVVGLRQRLLDALHEPDRAAPRGGPRGGRPPSTTPIRASAASPPSGWACVPTCPTTSPSAVIPTSTSCSC